MKTKKSLLTTYVLSLLFTSLLNAQNPIFQWVKQTGGMDDDGGASIVLDKNGNVYSLGSFKSTVDFDPGPGTSNLTAIGESDIYIQKLDANGNLLWAKQIGGFYSDFGTSITIDINGHIYSTGSFKGTVDFDPGTNTTNLSSTSGSEDIFIQKLDSNGNFLWAKHMGGKYSDIGMSITTDAQGYIYTTGNFDSIADFDPGSGTFNLITEGRGDIFIQKLDSNGNLIWAKHMGAELDDFGRSITTDVNGNVYATGIFIDTVDFNPGSGISNLISVNSYDIFILKLNSNGSFLWAKQIGGRYNDFCESIITDKKGNIYTTGNFEDTVDFDPGTGIFNLIAQGLLGDVFILKLNAVGNFIWAKKMGSTGHDNGQSICTDTNGHIYTTGSFEGTVDFDPGSNTTLLTSGGGSDIFIQKIDTTGNLIWANQLGGVDYDYGNSITADPHGNVYTTGAFASMVDFDPGTGIFNLSSNGANDVFIHKVSSNQVGLLENYLADSFKVYPNPTQGKFFIEFENIQKSLTIRLLSVLGQEIKTKNFQNAISTQLDLNQPNGIYVLEIMDEQGNKAVVRILKE